MKASQGIKDFVKNKEGFSSKPYYCPAGVPTIGYGSTLYPNGKKVTMKDSVVSPEEADKIFDWHFSMFEKDVNSLLPANFDIPANQSKFDALCSFAYNVGSDIDADDIPEGLGDSTLLKMVIKDANNPAIRQEFMKWNKANKKVSNGLTKRRGQEADWYFKTV